MKLIPIIALLVLLCGCGESYTWHSTQMPLTPEQKDKVGEMTQKFLSATPSTISGDDQDWEDAINAAHRAAMQTYGSFAEREYCIPDLFSAKRARYTGRIRVLTTNGYHYLFPRHESY